MLKSYAMSPGYYQIDRCHFFKMHNCRNKRIIVPTNFFEYQKGKVLQKVSWDICHIFSMILMKKKIEAVFLDLLL